MRAPRAGAQGASAAAVLIILPELATPRDGPCRRSFPERDFGSCSNFSNRSAFTLLEVMLAVLVLALISVSIYRFVETTLTAVRLSTRSAQERELTAAFARYLRSQMLALPGTHGAIKGEPHRFTNISSDELRWICQPGSGLLTRHATGEWTVTLTLKELGKGEYELGLRRQDLDGKKDATWWPLFRGVRGLEFRYYNADRKEWLEKWTDPQSRPALVRMKLWRDPSPEAYEIVMPIAAGAGFDLTSSTISNPIFTPRR